MILESLNGDLFSSDSPTDITKKHQKIFLANLDSQVESTQQIYSDIESLNFNLKSIEASLRKVDIFSQNVVH